MCIRDRVFFGNSGAEANEGAIKAARKYSVDHYGKDRYNVITLDVYKRQYVTIHFEKGVPTAVDGKEMGAVELVEHLNKLGGENGIGLLDCLLYTSLSFPISVN